MAYFWYFLGYGFLGYLLEKLFAALTHAEHRVRKGFLLAPVCPVYGLAMCAVLALGADRIGPLWELALLCSITATTAEYAVHLFCDAVLGVRFWDYSATKTDVNGRICLPFSLAWGVLGALAVRLVQPRAGGSRRRHSVRRDEHRAALPRHRRAVEHRRAAALGRH